MSEPAYVCMECARTTSGKCAQHSYVPMPKQDILGECMQPASEPEPCPAWVVNRLNIAVNESCTCGGREPDHGACPACMVWHRMDVRASWADRPKPAVVRIGREDIQRVFGHRCESPSCPACRGAR